MSPLARAAAAPAWTPPEELHEYKLVQPLGAGAMGQVFLAHDRLLDRLVAVKFIAGELDGYMRERFIVEARAAARLQHPNVVTVYRVGELDQRPYLVSEFVRGETLDVIAKPMPSKRIGELAVGLARGLAAAHRRGVLHRDIKPANAIVDETGDVKLLDFGLAKLDPGAGSPLPADRLSIASHDMVKTLPIDSSIPPDRPATLRVVTTDSDGSLTRAGTILGTPSYMSPEAWRGEVLTRRSDIYSLGALLYELAAGSPPHRAPTIGELQHAVEATDAAPIASIATAIEPSLAAIIDRCLRRDPSARFASGEELVDALDSVGDVRAIAEASAGNPYRGLAPFEAEHRASFFGRGSEIRALVDRLRSDPFVLVAGESGVGKSSLCRAGVLPAVAAGALGERALEIVTLVPGHRPLASIAAALAGLEIGSETELVERLVAGDVAGVVREIRAKLGKTRGVVVFVDQLEEIVTLAPPDEARIFAELLAELALPTPGVRLIATVRGDFLTRLAQIRPLDAEIARALYVLRPLDVDGIRAAVVGPARTHGVAIDESLVDALVDATSASTSSAGLPLLQFALAELWEARDRDRGVIPFGALEKIGGVSGALARHADGVLAGLLPGARVAAKRVLTRLVMVGRGPDGVGTRARRNEAELVALHADASTALRALVHGRLIVPREDDAGSAFEVAHEALIVGWVTLRDWLHDDVDRRVLRERLERSATEWRRLGCPRDLVWTGRQLDEARRWPDDDLAGDELAFLDASRAAARRRRMLRLGAVVGVPVVIALAIVATRIQASRTLDRRFEERREIATASLEQARVAAQVAADTRSRALSEFDAHRPAVAEAQWKQALARIGAADVAYGRATQDAETAVLIDGSRDSARALLADVIFERALLAERDHHDAQVAELLQRLALFDEGGERRRKWDQSAVLAIDSVPSGATVIVEQFHETDDDKGHWEPVGAGRAAVTPLRLPLARGSYRLAFSHPDRDPMLLPVMLERGETYDAIARLPAAHRIPSDWAYIPAGRFLLGSGDEESYRSGYLATVPIHPVVMPRGFSIQRHETTFAEWIEWLDTLPAAECARRTPKVASVGTQGDVELRRLPDGVWELHLQPATVAMVARWGESVRYPGRKDNAVQDWRQFPVSGVSFEDATAYAAWRSARLCTDEEWEYAARGADGRRFPHGKHIEPSDVNNEETYGHDPLNYGPDVVGSHPASRSPFGVDDMAGNVWEWVKTTGRKPGLEAARGGAYPFDSNPDRTEMRDQVESTLRDITLGVRLCRDFE